MLELSRSMSQVEIETISGTCRDDSARQQIRSGSRPRLPSTRGALCLRIFSGAVAPFELSGELH